MIFFFKLSDYKTLKNQSSFETFQNINSLATVKDVKQPEAFKFFINLLKEKIIQNNKSDVSYVLNHIHIDKSKLFTKKILTNILTDELFILVFNYCLSVDYERTDIISSDLLFTISQKTRKFDKCLFDPEIIENLMRIFQKDDQETNEKIIKIILQLSKNYSNDSIIFWDFMKSISNRISEIEYVSEFIYYEIQPFFADPDFNFDELFEIMMNILTFDNQIADSNILMSINKAIGLGSQNFIDFFINEKFVKILLDRIYCSQLKSVKKEAVILLTTFITKFDQIKLPLEFPLLQIKSISNLLDNQYTTLVTLRYLTSIIRFHPNVFNPEHLPIDFDINFLICKLLKIYSTDASFNIKIESSILICHLIEKSIINRDLLFENYSKILSILLDVISADFDDTEIYIEILIKVCSDFLTFGITQAMIQEVFDENDADIIISKCLEKRIELTSHIQSLNDIILH